MIEELKGALDAAMNAKVFEIRNPKPGFRHQKTERIVQHRFPVKGGISSMELLLRYQFGPGRHL